MTIAPILRGMAYVSFWAEDLKVAREWYTKLLGVEPYFQRPNAENPAYLEFRIGDFQDELGIIDKKYASKAASLTGVGGAILYWHVDNVVGMLEKLKGLGAIEYDPLTERGTDWITASVVELIGLLHRWWIRMETSLV
ncbi:VOC family protein [Cytobacillus citreus]|uniref:VOC family protein n=1 Tax=Cytobacillus citreus TaxID=2833586 RepID=UPI003B83401D